MCRKIALTFVLGCSAFFAGEPPYRRSSGGSAYTDHKEYPMATLVPGGWACSGYCGELIDFCATSEKRKCQMGRAYRGVKGPDGNRVPCGKRNTYV